MKKSWRSITGNDGITRENKNRMNTSPFSNVIFIGNGITDFENEIFNVVNQRKAQKTVDPGEREEAYDR